MKVLLGVTGSVAATLTDKLVKELHKVQGHEVKVILTKSSRYFLDMLMVKANLDWVNHGSIYEDHDEWPWDRKYIKGAPILHIDLRNWADVLLIAPLSANTLAKLANGITDNLISSVARAWDMKKPVVLAPAMNTHMWEHPATAEHLLTLMRWYPNIKIINPIAKELACGDVGIGAMAEIKIIVEEVNKCAH